MKFAVIDFESANSSKGSICSAGVVIVDNMEIVDIFYSLVNPQCEFDVMCMRVHGIKPEHVADAPTFKELWESKLGGMLRGKTIVAYNASYDIYALEKALYLAGIEAPNFRYACAMTIAKQILRLKSYALKKVADHCGISFEHHNALEDAKATASILKYLADICQVDSLNALMRDYCLNYEYTKSNNFDPSEDYPGKGSVYASLNEFCSTSEGFFKGKCVYIARSTRMYTNSAVKELVVLRGGRVVPRLSSKVDTILIGFNNLVSLRPDQALPESIKTALEFAKERADISVIYENEFVECLGDAI